MGPKGSYCVIKPYVSFPLALSNVLVMSRLASFATVMSSVLP